MSSFVLAVPLTVISVLGLLLNVYILIVVVLTKQVQTANNMLLLHLGIVDTLLCSIFLIFSAPTMLRGLTWLGFGAPCSLHGFLFTLLHPVALWTVCGLNCDRYYAITSPLRYGAVVSPRKVAICLGTAWFVAFILCIPPLFLVAPYRFSPGLGGCAPDFGNSEGAIWYSALYTALTLLLPAILILVCNMRVLMIARYHRHRIASAIFEVTLSAQVTITHQRNPFFTPSNKLFRGKSAVSTVLQLIGSFLVLYFPYYGVILWESSSTTLKTTPSRVPSPIVTLASTLLTCSPSVNGLLYGIKSKILRKTFQNYWRKQKTKCEMNQEIQARTPSTCGSRRPSLTPLGLLTRPATSPPQRRLSEIFIDSRQSPKPKIQRIASEISWRPQGVVTYETNSLRRSNSCRDQTTQDLIKCNTLQVPQEQELKPEELFNSLKILRNQSETPVSKSNLNNANLFLQKVFGVGSNRFGHCDKKQAAIQTVLANTPRKSPRILITRAYSEDNDHTSLNNSPNKYHSSSSTTLIDKKWKKLRYDESIGSENSVGSTRTESESLMTGISHQDQSEEANGISTNSSSSSSTSDEENSYSRMYICLSETAENTPVRRVAKNPRCYTTEGVLTHSAPLLCSLSESSDGETTNYKLRYDNYILSWPTRRKTSCPTDSSKMLIAKSVSDISKGISEFHL